MKEIISKNNLGNQLYKKKTAGGDTTEQNIIK